MQICPDHWANLRDDVRKYGLNHLIAPSGEAAAAMAARQVEGKEGPLDFDPLMNANWQLSSIALDFMGLSAMEGDKCPVCLLEKYDWCEGAAYQSLLYAQKNGLLNPAENQKP